MVFTNDDDHNDVIVNHHASNDDHDIHVNNNTHTKDNDDAIYENNNVIYGNDNKHTVIPSSIVPV